MEKQSLSGMKKSEAKKVYVRRRVLLALIVLLVAIGIALVILSLPRASMSAANKTPNDTSLLPPPIFEEMPVLPVFNEPEVNDTVPEPVENCTLAPIEELGCLIENVGISIFGATGLNVDDRNVKNLIKLVERECDTDNADGYVDRDCIIDTVVYNSENSWVCEWECLEDLASCETYKMHLAVQIARRYIPADEIFVARTQNFNFFLVYKDNQGQWIQKFAYGISRPVVEALYNDFYHAGPMTEVVFPDILELDAGDKFCFDIYATRSCVCSVEVQPFSVGDCPELPADLRGICDKPINEVYLNTGKNQICFTVAENATEGFYTYNFELTSGEDYIPAGNAFMKKREWDCCVNDSFKGFLSIED